MQSGHMISSLFDESELIQAVFNNDINAVRTIVNSKEEVNVRGSRSRTAAHAAAYTGNTEIMKTLILSGADIGVKDSQWLTPLHIACAKGNEDVVCLLLKNQADVNVRDKHWLSPVHVAAANNSLSCVEYLSQHLSSLNFSDRAGHSALHHATLNGHKKMVNLLLELGAAVGSYDRQNRRALHWAAFEGEVEIIQTLVAHGADINCKDKHSGNTPAHAAAAAGGLIFSMKTLIDFGYNVNTENFKKNTALHIACFNGHEQVAQLLVNAGSDVNKQNKFNCTPLHYAAISSHGVSCLEMLLNQNANVDSQDSTGKTALHLSAIHGRYTRAKTLLDFNAQVDIVDNNQNTALHYAAKYGHELLLHSLLNTGADPFLKGENGRLPLHLAALNGHVDCCKRLLTTFVSMDRSHQDVIAICDEDQRSSIHHAACSGSLECLELFFSLLNSYNLIVATDKTGRMPLHYAVASAKKDCTERLLTEIFIHEQLQVDLNLTDQDGRSALHHASASDVDGECVELLISKGADVLISDRFGATALHYASACGHDSVVKLLVHSNNELLKMTHLPEQEIPTPLHLAAYYGYADVVLNLSNELTRIDIIDVDIPDNQGRSPLELAVSRLSEDCVKALVRHGASPAKRNIYNNRTVLHSAAFSGNINIMEVIVDSLNCFDEDFSKFINAKDGDKCTALMYSVTNGHKAIVDFLLEKNASLWPIDKFGCTVLHRAAVSADDDMIETLMIPNYQINDQPNLLESCKLVGARNFDGRTALHFAAIRGNSGILEALLQLTQTVNVIDRYGYTPLHYACLEGHEACVQSILNHDSFCEFKGSTFSPLHCAVFNDNESCAELLIQIMGEDIVNLKDWKGRTPLHICALTSSLDCTKFLIIFNADVDATDSKQRSPLIVAAYQGSHCIIEELLQSNANYKLVDEQKNNILHVACLSSDCTSAQMILNSIVADHSLIDAQNCEGKTPLHIAARQGLTNVVMKLIEVNCSIDLYDNNGLTPALACAPTSDVVDCLDLILSVMASNLKNTTLSSSNNYSSILESFETSKLSTQNNKSKKRVSSIYFSTAHSTSKATNNSTTPTENEAADSDSETF